MKIPAHAKRVVYTGMLTVTILYSAFGLIGYLAYGDHIQASITLNLCGRDAGTAMSAIHIFIYLLLHSLYIVDCSCSLNCCLLILCSLLSWFNFMFQWIFWNLTFIK